MKKGGGLKSLRIFLEKLKETTDEKLIGEMTRSCRSPDQDEAKGPKILFNLEA